MSKLKPCLTCKPEDTEGSKFALVRGFTRHANRVCSQCRRYGPPSPTPNYSGRAA